MKCCRLLLHQIVFSWNSIHPCCSYTINFTGSQLQKEYNGQFFDVDEYLQNRRKFAKMFKDGQQPPCFRKCSLYEPGNSDYEKVCFDVINVSHRSNCNCNCIYCDLRDKGNQKKKQELNRRIPYDIRPVLSDLQRRNLISDGCVYYIGGGEVSEYPENEQKWLLLYAMNNDCKIELMSSAIKYSVPIEKVLRVCDINFKISPDAGRKETYEKIKRVKAFDIVWKNIAKYQNAAKDNQKAMIEIKYIIIPGINDNIDEGKAFVEKCRNAKVKNIVIDIEHYWLYGHRKDEDMTSIKELLLYFKSVENEFHIDYISVSKAFLENLIIGK